MTLERAKRLIYQFTSAQFHDEALVNKIAERMVENDECVWHATAQVTGNPCWCADCQKTGGAR